METETKESGLKEILQAKITHKIDERQPKVMQMLNKIESEGLLMNDFIAPLGIDGKVRFTANGCVKMKLDEAEYCLHPHALNQAAEKLGVPAPYLRTLQGTDWGRQLCSKILNDHTDHTKRQRLLVRSIGGEVRGILSDSYRRLNTSQIYGNFIKAIGETDSQIIDAFSDDTRSFIETLNPRLIEIPTLKNGILYVAYGLRISSSDFGNGALEIRAFMMQAVCLNGLVTERKMREIHLGGRIPDNMEISNETFQLDTKTQSSLTYDMVKQLMSPKEIDSKVLAIQAASSTVIDTEKEISAIVKKALITKAEETEIKKVLMENKPEDGVTGEGTLWKLAQGISAIARNKDGARERELHEIAGTFLN